MITPSLRVRRATPADIDELRALVARAVRELGGRDYSRDTVESGLRHVFGVDSQLIEDGTYFVAEAGGRIAGAGGWSRRRALYGADQARPAGGAELLEPGREPAKIRAFYVSPDFARRGVGRRLMMACEAAARRAGFTELELVATITGEPLYRSCGFAVVEPVSMTLPDGQVLLGARMLKRLAPLESAWAA